MASFDPGRLLKEVGGVFKFGRGVLGRSSILLALLLIAVLVGVWRVHSEWLMVGIIALGAFVFFLWFFKVLRFTAEHPDIALLEGAEWTGYKRFQAKAKGYTPTSESRAHSGLPPASNYSNDPAKTSLLSDPERPDNA